MSKYLDTKEGSLEQSILGVWQTAIEEKDARMDGRTKEYREHRKKLESARLRREKKNLNKEEVKLEEGSKEEYQKFFNAAMKKFGIDSPADLKSDEEKKKFFDYVDKNYKGEKDEEVQKLRKELFGLEEGKIELPDHDKGDPDFIKLIKKLGLKAKTATVMGDDGTVVTGKPDAIEKMLNTMYGNDWKDMYKRKGQNFIDIDEKVQVKEGKMSQIDQMLKDGKSAEEIAKKLRLDVKALKKIIGESYEIGTDEYRKHTEDVTPGENGEWAKHVGEKSQSMREALAKVWGVSEGKSPFKKEEKKSLTKEVKDGKTMTGKKIASVDINPTIKEKAK